VIFFMINRNIHRFDVTPAEAIGIQKELCSQVVTLGSAENFEYVAGVDVSIRDNRAIAAVAVLHLPDLQLCDKAVAERPLEFPYVPGLLSFREIPVILDALQKLDTRPDVLLVDGQGIAHPRRLGLASHLGLLCNIPSVGVAKSRLIGTHDKIPQRKGKSTPLYDHDEIIGAVLCTRDKVKPLYISVGHRLDLKNAINLVMRCVTRFRLPETTRWAHNLAGGKYLENSK